MIFQLYREKYILILDSNLILVTHFYETKISDILQLE